MVIEINEFIRFEGEGRSKQLDQLLLKWFDSEEWPKGGANVSRVDAEAD